MCLNFVGPDALIGPLGGSFHRKSFAACGRRPTLPVAARRRKVRLSPFPPDGENCDHSLAPPLPGEPAALSFAGSTGEINQNATGDAADGLRLRYAPPRSIGPLSPDPITGVNPSARQIISGAQNLSGCPQFIPGHWALDLRKIAAAAIPPLRLALPSKRSRSVFRRTGGY